MVSNELYILFCIILCICEVGDDAGHLWIQYGNEREIVVVEEFRHTFSYSFLFIEEQYLWEQPRSSSVR